MNAGNRDYPKVGPTVKPEEEALMKHIHERALQYLENNKIATKTDLYVAGFIDALGYAKVAIETKTKKQKKLRKKKK